MCVDGCGIGRWVGERMRCRDWGVELPVSLMAMSALVFIKSSQIHIVVIFN